MEAARAAAVESLAEAGIGEELVDIDLATAPRIWSGRGPFFLWVPSSAKPKEVQTSLTKAYGNRRERERGETRGVSGRAETLSPRRRDCRDVKVVIYDDITRIIRRYAQSVLRMVARRAGAAPSRLTGESDAIEAA